jgi:hypothetical protein
LERNIVSESRFCFRRRWNHFSACSKEALIYPVPKEQVGEFRAFAHLSHLGENSMPWSGQVVQASHSLATAFLDISKAYDRLSDPILLQLLAELRKPGFMEGVIEFDSEELYQKGSFLDPAFVKALLSV